MTVAYASGSYRMLIPSQRNFQFIQLVCSGGTIRLSRTRSCSAYSSASCPSSLHLSCTFFSTTTSSCQEIVNCSQPPSRWSVASLTLPEASMRPRGVCTSSFSQLMVNLTSLPFCAVSCVRPSMISTVRFQGQAGVAAGGVTVGGTVGGVTFSSTGMSGGGTNVGGNFTSGTWLADTG